MIFLDHNAGAPPHPVVRERLRGLLERFDWANPSSPHSAGRAAKEIVEEARERVARSVGSSPTQMTFTSGATESNAAALRHWSGQSRNARTIVCTPVEHPSVADALHRLEREGWVLRRAPVDRRGGIPPDWIETALDGDVAFAVCMSANNETGATHPWRDWARECGRTGIPLHVDATQSWGREVFGVQGIRGSVAWSGHKVGALSGAGALWLSETRGFSGLAEGGPQERGRRAGTESVLAIAALGEAARLVEAGPHWLEWSDWREILWQAVAGIPGVSRTVDADRALPNTLHLGLPIRAETAVMRLDLEGVAVSAGSACASGSMRPSPVLLAMGWSESEAARGIRLSVGHAVDEEGVERAAEVLLRVLTK
ncbi:MAG TPA: aminotransferase class V-fold PLP-dependent enzyme [Fibrobacteria bacterium]|nr:aminotransferase class V-fold PLP-dependent enzyme [Fibrobacteria bacterium]